MRSNELTLGDAIKAMIKNYRLKDKLTEVGLINSWEKVVGKMIANHTQKLYVKNRSLYIKLDSAALTNELKYSKEKIVKALNKEVGDNVIDEIVFR